MDISSYQPNNKIEPIEDRTSITLRDAFKSYRSYYSLIIPQLLVLVAVLPVLYFFLDIFVYAGISIGLILLLGIIAIVKLVNVGKSAAKNRQSQIAITEISLKMDFAESVMVKIPLVLFLISICVVAAIVVPNMDFYDPDQVIYIIIVAVVAIIIIIAGIIYQFNKEWKVCKEAIQQLH